MLNQLIRKTVLSSDLCDLCGLDLLEGQAPQTPIHTSEPTPPSLGKAKLNLRDALGFCLWTSSPAGDRRILSCQGELHPDHTCETSRSRSSSRRNLQLIMFHKLPSAGTSSFQALDEAQCMTLAGLPKLQKHGGSGEHQSYLEAPYSLQERRS